MTRSLRMLAGALLLALLVGCVSPPPPSTMDEVLDGPVTAQARSTALESVDRWADGFVVPGLSEVARNQVLGCREGHNDWKTHDGYHLKCEAHSLVYFGWDDDFNTGATSLLRSLRSVCSLAGSGKVPAELPGDLVQLGPDASCGDGVSVSTELGTGHSTTFNVASGVLIGWDAIRWVSGPRDAVLWDRLNTSRWILVTDVQTVFFQDAA